MNKLEQKMVTEYFNTLPNVYQDRVWAGIYTWEQIAENLDAALSDNLYFWEVVAEIAFSDFEGSFTEIKERLEALEAEHEGWFLDLKFRLGFKVTWTKGVRESESCYYLLGKSREIEQERERRLEAIGKKTRIQEETEQEDKKEMRSKTQKEIEKLKEKLKELNREE